MQREVAQCRDLGGAWRVGHEALALTARETIHERGSEAGLDLQQRAPAVGEGMLEQDRVSFYKTDP